MFRISVQIVIRCTLKVTLYQPDQTVHWPACGSDELLRARSGRELCTSKSILFIFDLRLYIISLKLFFVGSLFYFTLWFRITGTYEFRESNTSLSAHEKLDIPIYVVTSKRWEQRKELLEENLNRAGFVQRPLYRSRYEFEEVCSGRYEGKIKDMFRFPSTTDSQEEIFSCEAVLKATDHKQYCAKNSTLDCRFVAIALEHIDIIKEFGTQNVHEYALVLEDDQIVWSMAAEGLKKLIEQQSSVDMYMLDDSFCFNPDFFPPDRIIEKVASSRITSYPRKQARTTGAYLISRDAANKLSTSRGWVPQVTSVDWQLNYAIAYDPGLLTHWVYPPLTCHGSQQEGTKVERRHSMHCCENHWFKVK